MLLATWFSLRQSCTELGVGSVILRGLFQPEISYEPRNDAIKLIWCLYFFHRGKSHSSEERAKGPYEVTAKTMPLFSQAFKQKKKPSLGN